MSEQDQAAGGPLAVVTGASSGIGREVALLLARRGYRLVLMARRTERLRQLAAEVSVHAPGTAMTLDLCQPEAMAERLGELSRRGPVDVLVNNAGSGLYRPFLDHAMEDFRRLMEVHYFAAVSTTRAVLPGMLERRRGHVINVASIAAKVGPWGHAGYAASKSALATLTQSLAAEYGRAGIRFTCVHPGIVETEFFSHPSYQPLLPRVRRHAVSAGYAARKIVSLLDRPRLELCIPAHYRVVDWFRALSPVWAQHLVNWGSRPPQDGVSGDGVVPGGP